MRNPDGFYLEAHPKLRPVESTGDGICLAGAFQSPNTFDEAVSPGRTAAVKAAIPQLRGSIPVGAIGPLPQRGRVTLGTTRCQSCGTCAGVCPNAAAACGTTRLTKYWRRSPEVHPGG